MVEVKYKKHLNRVLMESKKSVISISYGSFTEEQDEVFRYQGRLCVSDVDGLREKIMEEAHGS